MHTCVQGTGRLGRGGVPAHQRLHCSPDIASFPGVFFALCSGTGCIRVGWTDRSLAIRLSELQVGNPRAVFGVLVIRQARQELEARIHRQFAAERVPRSAWFEPSQGILSAIAELDAWGGPQVHSAAELMAYVRGELDSMGGHKDTGFLERIGWPKRFTVGESQVEPVVVRKRG